MTIFNNSRYRFGDIQKIQDASGEYHEVHRLRKTTLNLPVGSVAYRTIAGDTFEALAARFYDDADRWYILADANPKIFWPLDLLPGMDIMIPPISTLVSE